MRKVGFGKSKKSAKLLLKTFSYRSFTAGIYFMVVMEEKSYRNINILSSNILP